MAFGTLFLSLPAAAARVDCTRATGWRDRLICETPSLSALDARLEQVYRQRQALLSPYGSELLQRSQQSWLRYVATVCPMAPAPTIDDRAAPINCLQLRYQERLTELAEVARKLGPFVFNRIDLFAAEAHDASDQTGSVPGFNVQHLAYPQIDNASSVDVSRWNKIYDKGDVEKDASCDEDTDYEVGYANQHVVSVQLVVSDYCHGTPHGFFSARTENLVWDQNSRSLTPNDVFALGWKERLKQLFWNALLAKGWTPPSSRESSVKDEIEMDVIKPDRWLFDGDGLNVSFNAYEGGCYACNPGTTTVPWGQLKPLLAPAALLP